MLGKFSCVADPGQQTLIMSQTFDATKADVFEAWTTPEQIALWWDPTGVPLAVCEIDLRPGGMFRWINQGETGRQHPFTGIYREIVPFERLVFDAQMTPAGTMQRSTLVFAEQNGMTTLTMTIQCQSEAQRDAMLAMRIDVGTARTLANLDTHLERKRP